MAAIVDKTHFWLRVFSLIPILLLWPAMASSQDVSETDATAAQSVISDQMAAFKIDDNERAYSHAAPSIKGYFPTVERFIAMVKRGYDPIYRSGSHVFGRNRTLNSELYQEVFISDRNGKQWQAVYTLKQQEDGSWKITGVKINPHSGTGT